MNPEDRAKYIARYNERLKTYGYDLKTLCWGGDRERQQTRFRVHMELRYFVPREIGSVLDVGCGFGDMGNYLETHYPHVKYTGIDINPSLIEEGKKRFPTLDLRVGEVTAPGIGNAPYDLVCASGLFNYKLEHQDQLQYIKKTLEQFFSHCNIGVSSDFMSTFVDYRQELSYHLNEFEALKIAKGLSRRVVLRNDYLDYEYCLYILKPVPGDIESLPAK